MAAQYKTRCPHCGAQFRISEEHLRQAKGKVRCGSCLEVFQATQHLIDEQGNPVKPRAQQQRKQSAPARGSAQQRSRTGSGNQSGNGQGRAATGPGGKQHAQGAQTGPAASGGRAQQGPEGWSLPGQDESTQESSRASRDDDPSKKNDYLPANDTGVSLGESEFSDSFLNADEEGSDHDFSEIGGGGDTDESWAEQLLEELDEDTGGKSSGREKPRQPPSPESMSLLDEWDEDEEEPAQTASDRGSIPEYAQADADAGDDADEFDLLNLDQGGADDELDFVEIEAPEEKPARKASLPARPSASLQWIKWTLLSLVALAVLAGQHLAFRFNELARQPDWRPLYAQACELVGCTLPRRSDITQLRGANLVVRSHPRVADALVVDAIIFNEAAYPQPFPQLELTFSSLKDEPIASRRFRPAEYRAGELKDLELMPSKVPIHVSLEILDPGEKAVNYSLRFHPPATDGEAAPAGGGNAG